MRAILASAVLVLAVLVLVPTAGASCHACFVPGPVGEYLSKLLS